MDIRDLFAAFAMAGMLANPSEEMEDEDVAESAYALADLMVEERDAEDED